MKALNKMVLMLIMSLLLTPQAAQTSTDSVPYYMYNAASAFRLDVALLYAICTQESRCRAQALNKDDATLNKKVVGVKEYSHGLFQIKMATARGLGFKGTKKQLMKPEVNTWYAAKLLRTLYDKHKNALKVISAYNAGRPIKGNKKYVNKVLEYYAYYKLDRGL